MTLKKDKLTAFSLSKQPQENDGKTQDEIYDEACEVVSQFIYV